MRLHVNHAGVIELLLKRQGCRDEAFIRGARIFQPGMLAHTRSGLTQNMTSTRRYMQNWGAMLGSILSGAVEMPRHTPVAISTGHALRFDLHCNDSDHTGQAMRR